MVSKVISFVILVPIAVVLIIFCVANREMTTLSLDPLGTLPQLQLSAPLFVLLMGFLIVGVFLGGIGTFVTQAHYRRAAFRRKHELERARNEAEEARERARRMRAERDQLAASAGGGTALAPTRTA
ncbi:lipopolysaccharide assembly protein LapA domain-containing protein [Consotaella salsifontis]|uniref:Lipopolysaccharide assembly protein A domain-containing protein n=1 Tax=Consotaella salsifontis TaxID=1365950 RepID=A0A1T4QGP4_9HYPH|nr:LapA family protein [Consotaella salsifontis]SKA02889.1 Protein of unknown function [Consotaella salsifontis]